jgi:hypothetical protein
MTVSRFAFTTLLFAWVVTAAPGAQAAELPIRAITEVRCPSFETLRTRYEKRFLAPMGTFGRQALSDLRTESLLYPFSGPDAVTPLGLFTSLKHLTLVADQIPEYGRLHDAVADSEDAVARECRMLGFFAQLGYYRTHDLNGRGGERPPFIQLIAYSIAFAGASIEDVQPLTLTAQGEATALPSGDSRQPAGVRFLAKRPDGRAITVDYLAIDLSNRGINRTAGAEDFLRHRAAEGVFLKAASHLLQEPSFSRFADILTAPPAAFVVQDETGLSVQRLESNFDLTLYGQYTAPQKLWAHRASAQAFADLYARQTSAGRLPFVFGYEKAAGSALIIARHRTAH